MKFESLNDARSKILGVSEASMARLAGLETSRLLQIEASGIATLSEWHSLGQVLGIDPDDLSETPIEFEDDLVGVLPYLEEFKEVSATTKARIIAASTAARDLADLRRLLGEEEPTWDRYQKRRRLPKPRAAKAEPYEQGRHYASKVRGRFAMHQSPVTSMRNFVSNHFPEITVLYADLADSKLAGVSMADRVRGPVIVLNTAGKNENHLVRRFSLAHELCHLLVDSTKGAPLAQLSGYKTADQLDIERRANSFATRFLCPEAAVKKTVKEHQSDNARARHLITKFGLNYQAARLHLLNVVGVRLPHQAPATLVGAGGEWRTREPTGLDLLPFPEIPPERRTFVAQAAAAAYSRDLISRGKFAELLGVDRTGPMNRILDILGLEPPEA